MKLVVQVPAYNEELHLERALDDLRSALPLKPFERTEIVVVNDGSADGTLRAARRAGVRHIVDLPRHRGLGAAFKKGLECGVALDADVIVNTDADGQYRPGDIPALVRPLLERRADMVVGSRRFSAIPGYSVCKLASQTGGNLLLSALYGAAVRDATSGFRAFSRETAELLLARMENDYTYTVESLCLLMKNGKRVSYVPIHPRRPVRPSRLITSKSYYVWNYLATAFSCLFKGPRR